MSLPLLILRPEPGATATANRARAIGLAAFVEPLFRIEPLSWDAPDPADFDAVAMTSANAARHGGPQLARFRGLPLYAVGPATAAAAKAEGFDVAMQGKGDAGALWAGVETGPHRKVLHLGGAHLRSCAPDGIAVVENAVYRSRAVDRLSETARDAARSGAVALLHSPRAATLFASLIDREKIDRALVQIVAISAAAARRAGTGWAGVMTADEPSDAAMLAIARGVCENGAP